MSYSYQNSLSQGAHTSVKLRTKKEKECATQGILVPFHWPLCEKSLPEQSQSIHLFWLSSKAGSWGSFSKSFFTVKKESKVMFPHIIVQHLRNYGTSNFSEFVSPSVSCLEDWAGLRFSYKNVGKTAAPLSTLEFGIQVSFKNTACALLLSLAFLPCWLL